MFNQNLKLAQLKRKFRITEISGYMFVKWTETDGLPQLIMKYQPCGKLIKGRNFESLLDC